MIDILLIIFFSELVIILGYYIVTSSISDYKEYKLNKIINDYEKSVFAPLDEQEPLEEILDEGYIKEVKEYEQRIAQARCELNNEVEYITDEQEKELE